SYMKIHHGSFTVSKISELTFKRYFVAQGIMANTKMEWTDAVRKGESLTTSESLDYILKNKLVYLNVYFKNLKDNIKAYPVAFVYPEEYAHQPFFNYTYLMNDFYYYIHILFLIPSILMYVHFFRRKDWIRFVILTF